MSRPLQATIDLGALRHNLAVVRRYAPHAKALAVVKANAYGHGMLRAAAALQDAEGFAVLRVEEGIALREAGHHQTIALLEGFFSPDELPLLAEYRLTTVIHNPASADMLARAKLASKIDILLKINTGMNRLGFTPEAFPGALQRLHSCPNVGNITLATHFARADEGPGISAQLECFERTTQGLPLPRSLANSATLLRYPQAHASWVRPGIMLYGSSPFSDESAQQIGLRPVMTLTSRIIAVQNLQPGESVGYGGLFQAEHPTRVGIVACGYADGYPRHAPTGTPILVEGIRSRTLGRVSMDMLFADLTDIPAAGVGSPVTLWGKGLPVEDVAHAAGTIGYELLCALAQRVPVAEIG